MIKLDAIINDKKLLASIQKGVDTFNRSTAGKAKLNLKINEQIKGLREVVIKGPKEVAKTLYPSLAKPAATPIMFCSAIPTSKNLFGNFF